MLSRLAVYHEKCGLFKPWTYVVSEKQIRLLKLELVPNLHQLALFIYFISMLISELFTLLSAANGRQDACLKLRNSVLELSPDKKIVYRWKRMADIEGLMEYACNRIIVGHKRKVSANGLLY